MKTSLNFYCAVIIIILMNHSFSFGQDSLIVYRVPDANYIEVKVRANVQRIGDSYKYSYGILSYASSQQNIRNFFFLRKATIDSTKTPINWIGLLPADTNINKVYWGAIDSSARIKPNSSMSGFVLYSKGLPNPIKYFSQGWIDIPILEEEPDSVENDDIFENSFKGITVAPKDPPTSFVPLDFLDTLKSYILQAYSLKWIADKKEDDKEKHDEEKDGKLVKELMKYLDKAREQLAKNKIKEAKKQLEKFVEKVEDNYRDNDEEDDEKSEHNSLTSEAYALLKYNAEYLIQQLK